MPKKEQCVITVEKGETEGALVVKFSASVLTDDMAKTVRDRLLEVLGQGCTSLQVVLDADTMQSAVVAGLIQVKKRADDQHVGLETRSLSSIIESTLTRLRLIEYLGFKKIAGKSSDEGSGTGRAEA